MLYPHKIIHPKASIAMPARKPLVIVTRKLPDEVETRMRELFDARLNLTDTVFDAAAMKAAIGMADILVPTVTDKIGADIIASAGPQLKMIANFGAGMDHIDLKAALAAGLTLTNTPGVLTDDTADITLALILAVARRIPEGMRALEMGNYPGWHPTWMMGRRLGGKRLGIIGMGRIGQAVAHRAQAFGLQIHYHNRKPIPADSERALEATYWESLDQMLARMDFVSVNCPRTPATYHLLSARRLKLMKPTAYLVNTARGDIVDEAALADLLEKKLLAGAGLDVFEHEPQVDPRLLKLPNVMLLPHLGSGTIEARNAMGEKVILNIKTFVDGHKPPDRILPAMV
jgi:glyoxylate reductase